MRFFLQQRMARSDPLSLLLSCLLLAAAAAGAAPDPVPVDDAQRVALPDSAVPRRYDIELRPDATRLRFSATVRIHLQVLEPTSTLTLNAVELDIDRASLSGPGGGQRVPAKVRWDAGRQEASFAFSSVLPSGEYTLSIDYRGRINRQPSGLFALDYDTPKGKRRALYTQFEAGDARRFVPCWDEPARKAVFALSALVRPGDMAVSNMPVASTRRQADGLQRVAFASTPRMSPYLLFFALGDFERVHRKAGRIDLGVIVERGNAGKADFALEAALQILPEYNDYFGTRYPLPKLDLVAAPGGSQATGAMENWGAMLFFDQLVLIDPRVSTQRDRQEVFQTIAHEMAHQWFGDLVTMQWWDDLWLNEGFATWMEIKIAERLHPEWKSWLRFESRKRSAIIDDAQDGAHAIVHPVRDVRQAYDIDDSITYDKAAAVIRMIEVFVGEDAFRSGVRTYMARHAYASTASDDLWREIEAQTPMPVQAIAHDFTLQPGVPLIDARPEDGAVSLSQGQFALDQAWAHPAYWRVPVTVAAADGALPALLVGAGASVSVPREGDVLLNAGQAGYYVSHYSPGLFQALERRFAALPAEDQLGLLEDAATLAKSGQAPMATFLELAAALPAQADAVVWTALCDELSALEAHYPEGAPADAFRAWIRNTLAPVLARLGWDAGPNESANTKTLRQVLLIALSGADDPAVIREARRRFERLPADPDSLQAEDRSTVIQIVALHADAATWDRLHRSARSARTVLEQSQFFTALGCARDPALARRALDLALSAEPPKTLALDIVGAVAQRHADLAFAFVSAHWESALPLLEPDAIGRFPARIAGQADDEDTATRLAEFALRGGPTISAAAARRTAAGIRYQASIRQQRLPEIDRWLAGGGYSVADRWLLGGSGGWDYLTYEAARQRLFVTRSDRIEVVDTTTGRIASTISGTEGAHGVAIAADLQLGFASNGRSDSVTVFDLQSLAVQRMVPVSGHNPDAIVYEPKMRRVFTFNGSSKDATVFDAATMDVVATLSMPDKPEFAVADGEGRVYVNIQSGPGQLLLIDSERLQVLAAWTLEGCDRPTGLAIDRARHRLFSTCANRVLAVTDGSSGQPLARVPIGSSPDAAAFDDSSGTVYSANGDGTLTLIRETSPGDYTVVASVRTQRGARTLALDPAAPRVFLLSSEFAAPAAEPTASQAETKVGDPGETPAGPPRARPQPVAGTATVLVVRP